MMSAMFEQLSLFAPEEAEAICCDSGRRVTATEPESWMKRLVPKGVYVVMVDTHPLVLCLTKLKADDIPEGHHYYHYLIGGLVYAGIFVGREIVG